MENHYDLRTLLYSLLSLYLSNNCVKGLSDHLCAFLCLVKIQQALMSMQQKTTVGEVHDVTLILYRDQGDQPEVFWQENQCFKLTFNTPYTQPQIDPYFPFDPANPPKCDVSLP